MTKTENELKALETHRQAYESSIQKLETDGGDPDTIALETRNLSEIKGRIDELKRVKGAMSSPSASIPRVQ